MSQVRLKPGVKRLFIVLAILAAFVYVVPRYAAHRGWRPSMLKTIIPQRVDTVNATAIDQTEKVAIQPVPGKDPAQVRGPQINYEIWAWNAQFGLIYANGGPATTRGSFMEKNGVNLHLRRQDDTTQMQNDLLAFANALKDGVAEPNAGTHFVNIMGDGSAQFFAALNPRLEKLGAEYRAEIVGAHGYSRGEDGFWGMPAWKEEPLLSKGALISGVLRDGDWNIAMKWASMNNIPNNPDEKTYDPNALNWVSADTYTKAAEMYVTGYCEDRALKTDLTKKKHVCINGVVTWTPGDVTIAKKRGGLVPLLTTRESAFQMPCVMIGIHKWNQAHRSSIVKILQSSFSGADQIRSNPDAPQRAAELSAEIYKEESPAYWLKYYHGTTELDAQGVKVQLGGSTVADLADNLQLFGLAGNSGNIMKADYETFGNLVVQQYPNLVPKYPSITEVLDTSYVQAVQSAAPTAETKAATPEYSASTPMKEIVGRRNYSIQFRTGSAEILPSSFPVLNQIYDDVLMTNMVVAVHGFTDNTGTPEGNLILSRNRAESVRRYLESKASGSFPEGRIRVFAHGQDDPVASNAAENGRAQNRRVQIVMGTVQ